ncbi:MAG: GNAT family N-acetyltransferase [Clostridia bacterium]|nr:GNAT family N-acetyltransferase [Clostridia bacterium]
MEIRFAKPDDVPGILKLLRQVGRVHHEGRPDIFRSNAQKYGPSQVLTLMRQTDTPIFVAVEDGTVLGYCFCQMHTYFQDPVINDFTTCYIDDLCVDENCRGRHIGSALYEAVCRYAKGRKCRSVTLNVWSCNESAMKFYQSLGLKPQKVGMEAILEENEC